MPDPSPEPTRVRTPRPRPFDPERHCGAHPDDPDKGPCRAPKGSGTDHVGTGRCKHHGGNSPGGKIHASREQAAREVARLGLPRDIDPATALLEEVHRCAGRVAWLETKVAALPEDRYFVKTMFGKDVNEWEKRLDVERRALVAATTAALRANVAERQVRLAEEYGAQLVAVIRGILDDLQLTADQLSRVPEIVPRHLRAVTA